jgi:hypothetical protein
MENFLICLTLNCCSVPNEFTLDDLGRRIEYATFPKGTYARLSRRLDHCLGGGVFFGMLACYCLQCMKDGTRVASLLIICKPH